MSAFYCLLKDTASAWERDIRRYSRQKNSFLKVRSCVIKGYPIRVGHQNQEKKTTMGSLLKPWTKYMEGGPEARVIK